MKLPAILAAALLAAGAAAAEEPDTVYARFHRAAVSGDLGEMVQYAPDAQRAEIAAMSPAQKAAQVKMLSSMLPRAYTLRQKNVAANGQSARLILSGPGPTLVANEPEMLFGNIRMVLERGAWKVAESDWSNHDPLPQAAPVPKAGAAAPKPAAARAPAQASPVVGGLGSAPERKFGTAKPPCEFKPVMTAEDLENCR